MTDLPPAGPWYREDPDSPYGFTTLPSEARPLVLVVPGELTMMNMCHHIEAGPREGLTYWLSPEWPNCLVCAECLQRPRPADSDPTMGFMLPACACYNPGEIGVLMRDPSLPWDCVGCADSQGIVLCHRCP